MYLLRLRLVLKSNTIMKWNLNNLALFKIYTIKKAQLYSSLTVLT